MTDGGIEGLRQRLLIQLINSTMCDPVVKAPGCVQMADMWGFFVCVFFGGVGASIQCSCVIISYCAVQGKKKELWSTQYWESNAIF